MFSFFTLDLMLFLRSLCAACTRYLFPLRTRLLHCNPSSIQFNTHNDLPQISDITTSDALNLAAHHLNNLDVVVFPTETVYGLGAIALNSEASAKIFSTKGRPPDNPLIVHVSSFNMLQTLLPRGYAMSPAYKVLTKHFWPGPLTLLFPREAAIVPSIITAGQSTVAVRMPSHPVARALIAITNAPLAAPSANTSGKPSPTRAEHVYRDLQGKVPLILDGGVCDVGLESTVVDGLHQDGNLRVLRPGGITVEDIERVLNLEFTDGSVIPKVLVHRRDYRDEAIEQAPTTPGMKYRHYSPTVPVVLLQTSTQTPSGEKAISAASFLSTFINPTDKTDRKAKIGVLAPSDSKLWAQLDAEHGVEWRRFDLGPTTNPAVAAQRLFDGFLTLDREGVETILIEEIQEEKEGLAVMNRVRKAAGEAVWITFD